MCLQSVTKRCHFDTAEWLRVVKMWPQCVIFMKIIMLYIGYRLQNHRFLPKYDGYLLSGICCTVNSSPFLSLIWTGHTTPLELIWLSKAICAAKKRLKLLISLTYTWNGHYGVQIFITSIKNCKTRCWRINNA